MEVESDQSECRSYKTRSTILTWIACLTCGLASATAQSAELGDRPNVILVMTDDQGYGDVRSHDNPLIDTPNLDQLAKDGARFKNFFVSPLMARVFIMTGSSTGLSLMTKSPGTSMWWNQANTALP